jgi:hypothetical protein
MLEQQRMCVDHDDHVRHDLPGLERRERGADGHEQHLAARHARHDRHEARTASRDHCVRAGPRREERGDVAIAWEALGGRVCALGTQRAAPLDPARLMSHREREEDRVAHRARLGQAQLCGRKDARAARRLEGVRRHLVGRVQHEPRVLEPDGVDRCHRRVRGARRQPHDVERRRPLACQQRGDRAPLSEAEAPELAALFVDGAHQL